MKFSYTAKTKTGKSDSGIVEASNLSEAKKTLSGRDLIIVSIIPFKEKGESDFFVSFFSRVSSLEKILFVKHLSLMIKGGLSLRESLVAIKDQSKNGKFKKVLDDILKSIDGGRSLSFSLSLHPRIFNSFYINMIKMGEESGVLEENLRNLTSQLEKNYQLRRRITAAMIYPAIILTAAVVLGSILTLFILPKITDIFKLFRTELPFATRLLIAFTDFTGEYGLFLLAAIFFLFLFFSLIYRIGKVKSIVHKIILKLPLFGSLTKNVNLIYFSRNLGILVKSGSPLMTALAITKNTLSNISYKKEIEEVIEKVKGGKTISDHLKEKEKLFPPTLSQMIGVGEKTGNLEEILIYLGNYYESEVDRSVKTLSTIIEPIILLAIGMVIGFVALAIITPIYELSSALYG